MYYPMLLHNMLGELKKKKKKIKLYFNNLLHIHQHTFLKYMIQSVIEGKIRRQICLYTIFPY